MCRDQGHWAKFFSCDFPKIVSYYAHPASPRGALRAFRHDTWGGDAMDVLARSVVDARTNDADADVKSCGPDLPVLGSRLRQRSRVA